MTLRRRLFVAVLLDGKIASEIDGLRRGLGSSEIERIPPHITLAPPVNVAESELDDAVEVVRLLAQSHRPFPLLLGPSASFARAQPVVYLAVADPSGTLAALAAGSRSGPLAPAERPDRPDFVPHVTLANRVSADVAEAALAALARYRNEVDVERLSILERDPEHGTHPWQEMADFPLGAPLIRGRGGIEVALTVSRLLDPWARQMLDDQMSNNQMSNEATLDGRDFDSVTSGFQTSELQTSELQTSGFQGDDRFSNSTQWAVTARLGNVIVGAAAGSSAGEILRVERFGVEEAHRREGIGSRVMETVEQLAAVRGARQVVVVTCDPDKARYVAGRGYREDGSEPDGSVRLARRPGPTI